MRDINAKWMWFSMAIKDMTPRLPAARDRVMRGLGSTLGSCLAVQQSLIELSQ